MIGVGRRGCPRLQLIDGWEGREVAREANSAPVADPALATAGRARQAALLLAAVDDHRYVRVVFVIALELGVELVRQGLRYDAVDHEPDPSLLTGGRNSVMC